MTDGKHAIGHAPSRLERRHGVAIPETFLALGLTFLIEKASRGLPSILCSQQQATVQICSPSRNCDDGLPGWRDSRHWIRAAIVDSKIFDFQFRLKGQMVVTLKKLLKIGSHNKSSSIIRSCVVTTKFEALWNQLLVWKCRSQFEV